MATRTVHDQSWGVGKCRNPSCGKLGVDLFPVTIREAMTPERSWTFEVCESCKDAFHRGELKFDRPHSDGGTSMPP